MNVNQQQQGIRTLSLSSVILGIIGGAFYWWLPLGIVLSTGGLTLGVADFIETRRRSLDHRLSVVGILISLAALILGIIIGALGLQTITFGG